MFLIKLYSVPADFKEATVKRIYELNERTKDSKVVEFYGQITDGGMHSGRSLDSLPPINLSQLERYTKDLLDYGMRFNYTINQSCSSNTEFSKKGRENMIALLKDLRNIGINDLTIALPSAMEIALECFPDMNVKASAICEINSVYKAEFYKALGVSRIVIDPDIVRDFELLKRIYDVFGEGIEVIATNTCMRNCPYKMFHYNNSAHGGDSTEDTDVKEYYEYRCFYQTAGKPHYILNTNWVRPEDIHLYSNIGVSHYKIDGRSHIHKGDILKTLEVYFKESFDGNLFDLFYFFQEESNEMMYLDNKSLNGFVDRFYESPHFCKNICENCNYCMGYFEKSESTKKSYKLRSKTAAMLKQNDRYVEAIKESH